MKTSYRSSFFKAAAVAVCLSLSACTIVNTATLPTDPNLHAPFVTTGDIQGPYQSLGLIQVTRKGHLLFGFVDIVGTDIQTGFNETLMPEIRRLNGDGIINVRFHQTQVLPVTQVVQAIFFVIPFLWTEVTITGEVVKLAPGGTVQPVLQQG
ncbi:MAG: hypothetical protein SF187_29480 [Deltaproteobacteria bacterium]|nr:hypothetical protein [Deltaproteobacteria bacterium]